MSIEQKIAELLEDSIKLKALNLQEAEETKKKSKKEEADESDEEEADESDEEEASEDDKPKFDFSKLKKKSVKDNIEESLEDYSLEELEDFMVSEDFDALSEEDKEIYEASFKQHVDAQEYRNQRKNRKGEGYSQGLKLSTSVDRRLPGAEAAKKTGINTATGDKFKPGTFTDQDNAKAKKKLVHGARSYAQKNEEYDVQEDVDALLFGEDLSEEFREKASVIFESAVMNRVNSVIETLEESLIEAYETRLQEEFQEIQEELEDKVDAYLGYIAEQWMKENELSIQKSLKSEILEGFVEGMKNLFQEHYIDVPDEQFDVVGDLRDTISQLETKLDESLEYNVEMRTQISTMIREGLVEDFCKELTDTEVEKFKSLSEELSYSSEEAFTSKLEIIKENYFSKKTGKSASSVVSDKPIQLTEEIKHIDQNVARYLDTFNRIKI